MATIAACRHRERKGAEEAGMSMKIVMGFVLRPEGWAALDRAIEEARHHDAHLFVIHSMRGDERDQVEQVLSYREALEEVETKLQHAGIRHSVHEFVRGKTVAGDVLEIAEEEHADLIVIGLRRRTPLGKLILGSHAQEILLNTSLPVLAVPAAEED